MTQQRDLYPLSEVAQRLGGISMPTLFRLIRDGKIKRVRIGTRSFVTTAELDRYIAEITATAEEVGA